MSCGGTFTGIPSRAFVNFVPRSGSKEKLERFGISHRRAGETGVLGILRGDGADRVFGIHTASDLPGGTIGLLFPSFKLGNNKAGAEQCRCRPLPDHDPGKVRPCVHPAAGGRYPLYRQSRCSRAPIPSHAAYLAGGAGYIGVGKLTAGTAYNAPAETAGLEGTTRSVSQESQERIRDLGSRTVSSISDLYGGTAEIQLHTPGAYAYWGTGNTAHPHTLLPNHNGSFDVDAEALILCAGLYAGYIF